MISKKALLIAVGMAVAMPGTSHALTRAELYQQKMKELMAEMEAVAEEEDKALEKAKAETKKVAEDAAQTEATLQDSINNANQVLENTRLEKKTEAEEAIANLQKDIKAAYQANQKSLAEERKLNKMIMDKHTKRVVLVGKAIKALTNIAKA